MFFGLFRKPNLFAKGALQAQKQFTCYSFILNMSKSLNVVVHWSKIIQHREREQKVTFVVHWSKTIQHREHEQKVTLHPLCPVTAECKVLQQTTSQAAKTLTFPITSAQFDKKLKAVTDREVNISGQFPPRRGVLGT